MVGHSGTALPNGFISLSLPIKRGTELALKLGGAQ
jgi:hypothetical protein